MPSDLSEWESRDRYTITQAALLFIGKAPEETESSGQEIQSISKSEAAVFEFIKGALCEATKEYRLQTMVLSTSEEDTGKYGEVSNITVNPNQTIIDKEELVLWIHENRYNPNCWKDDLTPSSIGKLIRNRTKTRKRLKDCYDTFLSQVPRALEEIDNLRKATTSGVIKSQRVNEAKNHLRSQNTSFQYVTVSHISDRWFEKPHGLRNARDEVLTDLAHSNNLNITKIDIRRVCFAIRKKALIPKIPYTSRTPQKS